MNVQRVLGETGGAVCLGAQWGVVLALLVLAMTFTAVGISPSDVHAQEDRAEDGFPKTIDKDFVRGDVNLDKRVDVADLSVLAEAIANEEADRIMAGDVNQDGITNLSDLLALAHYVWYVNGDSRMMQESYEKLAPGVDVMTK